MTARTISILGSTGSIGTSTLDIIANAPAGQFKVAALTAHRNYETLAHAARKFGASFVAISNPDYYADLKNALSGSGIKIAAGPQGLIEAAAQPADITMAAIIGAAGLKATLAAAAQGNAVALANKECLVCAGDLFLKAVERAGTTLLPVDSEHNAIFQVLETRRPGSVKRLILTASGGPFREMDAGGFADITPQMALKHPVWDMGAKISIDSATMMNKGLELIEASFLFGRPSEKIDIIIHPQSIVHSMVEYIDGSVLAQMGPADMRVPIAYALAWPERLEVNLEPLDLRKISALTFFEPDADKFPALRLARAALEAGGSAPNILNAANEMAVAAFLSGQISFVQIPQIVETALSRLSLRFGAAQTIEEVVATDRAARITAQEIMQGL